PEPGTVWNVASGVRVATCPSSIPQSPGMFFLSDDRTLLLKDDSQTWIWRLDHHPLAGHACDARAVAYSRNGDLLASGSADGGGEKPHTIKIWDPKSGRLIRGWFGGVGTVSCLAFAPDGKTLASAHLDETGSIRLWDVATGTLHASLKGHTKK